MCSRDLFAAVPAQLFLLVVDYLGTEAVEVVVSILGRDGEVRNQQFVHTHGCVVGHYLTELCWGTNQAGPVAQVCLLYTSPSPRD